MAKVRSPNYPSMSLGPALEAVRPVYQSENRNKMARAVLAKHLGYSSLNGRALGKIGAVRAYGLIEGSGDDLRVSDDAVKALMAPAGSSERTGALARLASRPALFQDLNKEFPDTMPSLENIKYALVKRQFTADAAEKAAKSYLATMNLVSGIPDAYSAPDEDDGADEGDPPPPPRPPGQVKIMAGERVVFTEENTPQQYLKLVACGEVDDTLLEALEDYVKRQRKRLFGVPPGVAGHSSPETIAGGSPHRSRRILNETE